MSEFIETDDPRDNSYQQIQLDMFERGYVETKTSQYDTGDELPF
jgi:hypothetical protein